MNSGRQTDNGAVGWESLVAALRKRDTISSTETVRLVKQYTNVSPDYALRRLQREGVLERPVTPHRGVYVVGSEQTGGFITDPIEAVQAACGQQVVFGYGTALLLHGLSRYGRLTEYYLVSLSRRNKRTVGHLVVRFVKSPLQEGMGVVTRRQRSILVHMTDLERTLIDAIHRPKYAQGWENVTHALKRAEGVSGSHMIEYVKQYRTPSLVSRVGLVLQRYAEKWKVAENEIDSLRPYLPKTPVKFARGKGGTLNRQWNLHVPEGLFND